MTSDNWSVASLALDGQLTGLPNKLEYTALAGPSSSFKFS